MCVFGSTTHSPKQVQLQLVHERPQPLGSSQLLCIVTVATPLCTLLAGGVRPAAACSSAREAGLPVRLPLPCVRS